jgi:hypothetical protein
MAYYKTQASFFSASNTIILLLLLAVVMHAPFRTYGTHTIFLSTKAILREMPSPDLLPQQVVAF